MYKVKKRDGKKAEFDIQKITGALRKAFEGSHRQYTDDIIDMLALRVTGDFEPRIMDGCIDVEDIQDSAEKVLSECGYSDVAKAYILYRKQRENIRNIDKSNVDYRHIVDSYLNSVSWRNTSGGTTGYSVGGLILSNSGAVTGNYWLSEIYDSEISEAHRNGDLYIHDLDMLTGHSTGWSLLRLIENGLQGVDGNISCGPSKHLNTLAEQMIRFFEIVQNEWAGSQSFSSFDTFLAPFVKVDSLTIEQVKQCMQTFVYGINAPVRLGYRSSVTHILLDGTVPDRLKKKKAVVGGKEQSFTYEECEKELHMIDDAYFSVMMEGDYIHKPFRYPFTSVEVSETFMQESVSDKLFEWIHHGGNVFLNLREKKELPKKYSAETLYRKSCGIFDDVEMSGSLGGVTLNIPRIAFESHTEEEYFRKLDQLLDMSARNLHTKKTVLMKLMDNGLYPYTKEYLPSLEYHFGMIEVAGMKEGCTYARAWMEKSSFVPETLIHIRERLLSYQKKYGMLMGVEGTCSKVALDYLAGKDRTLFPDMKHEEVDGLATYTDGNILPETSEDIFENLDEYEKLLPLFTSGSVAALADMHEAGSEQLKLLVRRIQENYDIPCLVIH